MDVMMRNLLLFQSLAEGVLFVANMYSLIFSCAIHAATSTFVRKALQNKALCQDEDASELIYFILLILPTLLGPGFMALYQMSLSQMKMFLSMDAMRKQQDVVFEIFEKQNEATMVLQQPNSQNGKASDQEIVYTNNAFKEIFSDDAHRAFNDEILKLKKHVEVNMGGQHGSNKFFSIKNLIKEPQDFISQNVFEVKK